MHWRTTLALLLALLASLVGAGEGVADEVVEIVLEAEAFQGEGWKKSEMGYCWGAPHLWSKAKLEADAGDTPARAVHQASIPRAGRYNLWVHYEDVAGFDTYFSIRVRQENQDRLVARFGRKEESKFCPFAPTPLTRHDLRWWYHHGDFVYESREVTLDAGHATFVIEKGKNGPCPAKRFVDFLLLTTHLEDNPIKAGSRGWFENFIDKTSSGNQVYMRLTAAPDAPAPLAVHGITYWPHQPPYYVYGQCFYTPQGRSERSRYHIPTPAEFLKPGQSTPWVRVRLRTTGDNRHWLQAWPCSDRQMATLARYKRSHADLIAAIKEPAHLEGLRIELASDPAGEKKLTTIVVGEATPDFSVFFTRDCRRPEHITTWSEINARRRKWIADANPTGVLPKRFPLTCGFWQVPQHDIRRAMGETWPSIGKILDAQTMKEHGFTGLKANWYVGYVKLPEPKLYANYRKASQKRQAQFAEAGTAEGYPKIIKLIDEPSMWSLARMAQNDVYHEGFRAYLRERSLPPEEFLSADAATEVARAAQAGKTLSANHLYQLVKLGTNKDSVWNPELYYHSQLYRSIAFADYYRPYAEIAHEVYGKECVGCPVNLAPNKMSFQQGWLDGIDYIDFFRSKGSTMMLSESWHDNVPGLVSQLDAMMMDLFRCAAKYHGFPFGQYAICDTNRSIDGISTALKTMALVSHGAGFVEYYCGEGAYPGSTDGPILEQRDLLQEITRVNYAIGEVEDLLLDGHPPKAEVALLWNRTSHIWDSAPERRHFSDEWFNVYLQEFLWLHVALRHAGIWVDIVTEDDCAEGGLKDYRVLYAVGEQIQRNAAQAIRQWVSDGGVLFSPAGGGLRDEYNRALDTLNDVYGITANKLTRVHRTMNLKVELPRQAAIDRLYPTSDGEEQGLPPMGAFAFRHTFPEPTGQVLAHFADRETPAMVMNQFGKGRAAICGVLLGVAYMKPSAPVSVFSRGLEPDDLMHFRPTVFDNSVRELILLPVRLAGVKPSSVCDPVYVEAVLWERGDTWLVALNNHSGKPLEKLSVTLPGLAAARGIRSQQKNPLRVTRVGGALRIELPVRLYDFLVMQKK